MNLDQLDTHLNTPNTFQQGVTTPHGAPLTPTEKAAIVAGVATGIVYTEHRRRHPSVYENNPVFDQIANNLSSPIPTPTTTTQNNNQNGDEGDGDNVGGFVPPAAAAQRPYPGDAAGPEKGDVPPPPPPKMWQNDSLANLPTSTQPIRESTLSSVSNTSTTTDDQYAILPSRTTTQDDEEAAGDGVGALGAAGAAAYEREQAEDAKYQARYQSAYDDDSLAPTATPPPEFPSSSSPPPLPSSASNDQTYPPPSGPPPPIPTKTDPNAPLPVPATIETHHGGGAGWTPGITGLTAEEVQEVEQGLHSKSVR